MASPSSEAKSVTIAKLTLIAVFWIVTAAAVLRPTRSMRAAFLVTFFALLTSVGLAKSVVWPFYAWDMWHLVQPEQFDNSLIALVDANGKEWRYDVSAVPPTSPSILEEAFGSMLLGHGGRADTLAHWLLRRANVLRDATADIRPRWWSTQFGFLPVGPTARESLAGWSTAKGPRPAEFVELVVRRRRVRFSTPYAPIRMSTTDERRFR